MNVDLRLSDVYDLCLQPLVDRVFGVDPLAHLEFPVLKAELLDVEVVRRVLMWALLAGPLSEAPALGLAQVILRLHGLRKINPVFK